MLRFTRYWLTVVLALMVSFGFADDPEKQEPEKKSSFSIPQTPDELYPGLPLDGSIIIDEDIWLRLVGEPGRKMRVAYDNFVQGDIPGSTESIYRAGSFLHIAKDNAITKAKDALDKAATTLDELAGRVADRKVNSADELKIPFGRAHLALSRHHAAKAGNLLKKGEFERSGNYLLSSVNHLQRAADWSNRELRTDTKDTVDDAKRAASRMAEEGRRALDKAGQLIETLGERIERFGRSLNEGTVPGKEAPRAADQLDNEDRRD